MLAAHFHISLDGTRLINYAEWIDVTSHHRLVEERPQRAESQVVKTVDETPGVRFARFDRYLSWHHAPAPD